MKIEFVTADGLGDFVELPDDIDDDQTWVEAVEEAAKKVCLESKQIKEAARSASANLDWRGWIRPIAYRFISHCLECERENALRQRIWRYNRHTDSDNVFSVGLFAIFAEDQANFTEQDRYKLSRELWYAFRHYVPWEFLNGFLSQLHGFEKQKALSQIENGFEDWIVHNRSVDWWSIHYRGRYPKAIEARVEPAHRAVARLFDAIRGNEDDLA